MGIFFCRFYIRLTFLRIPNIASANDCRAINRSKKENTFLEIKKMMRKKLFCTDWIWLESDVFKPKVHFSSWFYSSIKNGFCIDPAKCLALYL